MATSASKFGSFKGKVAANSAQQRSKQSNYGHLILPRGVSVFTPEPGSRINLDFMPYIVTDENHPDRNDELEIAVVGSPWYKRPYRTHRSIGAENVTIVCPSSIGKKCPICDYRKKKLDSGTKWDDPEVKGLRPSERSLYLVNPKGSKKFEEKLHIWDFSNFLFQNQLDEELEENPDFGEFPSLENGLTLKVRFSEETFEKSKYAATSRIDFEERDYAYPEETLTDAPSLDEVLAVKSYEEIQKLFFEAGEVDEDEAETGEETKPIRTLAKPKTNGDARKTVGKPPTQSDEQEENEVEEEEKKAAPKTIAKKQLQRAPLRRAAEPEPEPEEEEVDERPAARTTVPKRVAATSSAPKRVAAASSDEECPSGYQFGQDCDQHNECEECPVWNNCYAAKGD
jgi:hypothetical protein